MANRFDLEEAEKAYSTLLKFGKSGFNPDYEPSNAEMIASALVKLENYEPDFVFVTCENMMEQINMHEIAKMLRES